MSSRNGDSRAIRAMFSEISGTYDFLNRLFSMTLDKRWRRKAVAAAGIQSGDCVLDVCSGTGDLAFAFMEAAQETCQVVGADFSWNMTMLAAQKANKHARRAKVNFVPSDAMQLPFKDSQFDIAAAAFGIRNVENLAHGIREMTRVTQPGGRVVILEFTRARSIFSKFLQGLYVDRVVPWVGDRVSSSRQKAYTYLASSMKAFVDRDEMTRTMASCGLREIKVKIMNMGLVALHVGRVGDGA